MLPFKARSVNDAFWSKAARRWATSLRQLCLFDLLKAACRQPAQNRPIAGSLRTPSKLQFQHLATDAKLIEVVRPPLRHANTLCPVRATMISSANTVLLAMRQCALDRIRMPETTFI